MEGFIGVIALVRVEKKSSTVVLAILVLDPQDGL